MVSFGISYPCGEIGIAEADIPSDITKCDTPAATESQRGREIKIKRLKDSLVELHGVVGLFACRIDTLYKEHLVGSLAFHDSIIDFLHIFGFAHGGVID